MTNLKSNLKKILSFVLAIVMLVGVVPLLIAAAGVVLLTRRKNR